MRFYTEIHKHYCGIDLHARTMYVCILDREGQVLLHRNLPCDPERFLRTIAPYREALVVAVECIFTWYWLADLCARERIPFVLGHALYMRAIHGAKAKNDRIDSKKTAALLRGGLLPQGPTPTRPRCGPRGISCADASTSSATGASCWRTSRTPTTSTTSWLRASGLRTGRTGRGSAGASRTRASPRASRPTWR